jgi:hypothetical protein
LNHFTVPVAINSTSLTTHERHKEAKRHRYTFWI